MSDHQFQAFEVIAKEITIALVQKTSITNQDMLLNFACESFDRVLKQVVETNREINKG